MCQRQCWHVPNLFSYLKFKRRRNWRRETCEVVTSAWKLILMVIRVFERSSFHQIEATYEHSFVNHVKWLSSSSSMDFTSDDTRSNIFRSKSVCTLWGYACKDECVFFFRMFPMRFRGSVLCVNSVFFYVCLNVENNLQPVMNFRPLWRYYFSPGDHVNDDDDDGILISWRALQTATATKSNTNFCEFLMACAITEVYDPYGDVFMWQNYYYYFYCRFCILSNWEKRRNYILNSIKTNRCHLVSSKMWRKRRRKRQHFKCSFNLYNSTRLSLCAI